MSVNTEINRINTQVTSQASSISSIISLLKTKLGLTVSTGTSGTPLNKNLVSLTNIENAIRGYSAPVFTKTYTETLYNITPDTDSGAMFSNMNAALLPLSRNGKIIKVISYSHTSSDDYWDPVIINGSVYGYGDFYGVDAYNITVTYEAMS